MNFQGSQKNYLAYEIGSHRFLVPSYYALKETLGNGSYGLVVKAKMDMNEMLAQRVIHNNINNIQYNLPLYVDCAVKKITNIFSKESFEFQKKMLREIRIMKHLKHRNILSLIDIIPPPDFNSFNDLYLVSEFMECDLDTLIRSKDTVLSDEHIRYFMHQLLCGLQHIHAADILHRDLKPANILLNSNCDLKICDFGLSRPVDFHNDPFMSTYYVATRWYRAPELLLCSNVATKAIDIWSTGCIFGELLGRRVLFPGSNKVQHQMELIVSILGSPQEGDIKGHEKGVEFFRKVISREQRGVPLQQLFPYADPLALDLLQRMLQFNPDKRITAEDALQHPYFEGYYDNTPKVPVFDYNFEKNLTPETNIKKLIWDEIVSFDVQKHIDCYTSNYQDDMMDDN